MEKGNKRLLAFISTTIIAAVCLGRTVLAKTADGTENQIDKDSIVKTSSAGTEKARTVITTDGEVDDMNSVIRFMYYANEMDLEGIVLTSSVYHYAGDADKGMDAFRWTGTEWVDAFIDAYEEIYPNLAIHAEGYPEPDYLRSVYRIGNISAAGEMEEITAGSEFLKELFLDGSDNRPLYIQTWGGTNTTARALKSIEEEYASKENWEEIKAAVSKRLVIYIILDQDDTYSDYIAKKWPEISIINDVSNFWHFAYAWQYHAEELNTRLQGNWNYENIINRKGSLLDNYALMGDGKIIIGELYEEQRGTDDYLLNNPNYNRYDFISEGDSPSFFYLINNGLRSMENPAYGGWGSRFSEEGTALYKNQVLDYNPYSKQYEASYTLTRWLDDIQDDFAGRADWGIASSYTDANHNPKVQVNEGIDLTVRAGDEVILTALASDPDGDSLSYKWWRYFEADTYEDNKAEKNETTAEKADELQLDLIRELKKNEATDTILLNHADTMQVSFIVPEDARNGDTIHLIVEVQDDGAHRLKAYQRVILTVEDTQTDDASISTGQSDENTETGGNRFALSAILTAALLAVIIFTVSRKRKV